MDSPTQLHILFLFLRESESNRISIYYYLFTGRVLVSLSLSLTFDLGWSPGHALQVGPVDVCGFGVGPLVVKPFLVVLRHLWLGYQVHRRVGRILVWQGSGTPVGKQPRRRRHFSVDARVVVNANCACAATA